MLIDWFTVAAQALNFLILVWLMKRYLYQPILHAIDAREKRIADELADADKKKAEAKQERDDFEQKNAELDKQRASLLSKATEEADDERQRLIKAARKDADELSEKRATALQREQKTLHDEITRRAKQEVFAIARKTLSDLADASLEERMSSVFAQRMCELDDETKSSLGEVLSSSPAVVRSAFDLPTGQRELIQKAINETFSADIKLSFETTPELVSGIELSAGGQKVAWSISDYLASLEESVEELIKA
jgi:F-type H+-transporting ATPase subunit b